MRVLWVAKGLGPGGAERLLVASATARADDVDVECAYVLPGKDHLSAALERAGVRTHCLSSRRTDPEWPVNLARLIRSGNFDVVHVHSPLPGSVARLAIKTMKSADRPAIVATEHNTWTTHRLPTKVLNRWTSRWNDAAFAVTDEAKDSMSGRGALRVETLRHGIDVEAVRALLANRDEMRAEFGISPETITIGTVANFRPQKDYPNLIGAAALLHERSVPFRILAVGQGPLEGEMRKRAAELGLSDVVTLTGFRDDATSVMAACDIFVLASQWEGLPVAIMEATALGLPLVLTDVGGISEEFTNDVDALLVPSRQPEPLADALESLARSTERRERLAAASAARSADFDSSMAVPAVEATYRRVARVTTANPDSANPDSASEKSRTRRPPALDIRPAVVEDRDALIALMRRSLGGDDSDDRYPEMFSWKHDQNAFGASPMWVAYDGDRLAAARAFMRWEFIRGGVVVRAVRAVDTATDPDYQGKGLFTALTLHGIDEMKEDGIDFVFNTPNDKSRPGYLKMGWREVGNVPAMVRFSGVGGLKTAAASRVGAERWSEQLDVGESLDAWISDGRAASWLRLASEKDHDVRELRTRMDEKYLRWRFGSGLLNYRVVDDGQSAVIARARRRGAALELAVVAMFGDKANADRLSTSAAQTAGASHTLRLGPPNPKTGFIPLPGGGPILTWRAVCDQGQPPRSNWMLELGDIELF